MSMVRTCDQCGTTINDQPESWDWFRLSSGVGAEGEGALEACSYTCAQGILDRLHHQHEEFQKKLAAWEPEDA